MTPGECCTSHQEVHHSRTWPSKLAGAILPAHCVLYLCRLSQLTMVAAAKPLTNLHHYRRVARFPSRALPSSRTQAAARAERSTKCRMGRLPAKLQDRSRFACGVAWCFCPEGDDQGRLRDICCMCGWDLGGMPYRELPCSWLQNPGDAAEADSQSRVLHREEQDQGGILPIGRRATL